MCAAMGHPIHDAGSHAPLVTSGVVRLTRAQLVGTLTGLVVAMLLAALDQTIVGTAEPRIIAQLAGFDRYPWVATAYLLTSTLSVPIYAKLSDIYGRKRFFLGAASLFVVMSALCGAAGTLRLPIDGMNQLILFRGLQGIGAGGVMGLIFTIIGDIFSPAERGRYQGLFSAVWGFASVFGPTLGGWLTDHVSWRACFYVNLPVGLIAIAAIYFEFPNLQPRGATRRLDWWGTAALIGCVVPLLLAMTWATDLGWTAARVQGLLAGSAIMLAVFLFVESTATEPLIPLTLFRDPVISLCSICVFVLGMGMFGVIIYLPLFMQGVLRVSATQSGNLMMPMMMGVVFGTFFSGSLMSRLGTYKVMAVIGSLMVASGMSLFAQMTAATPRLEVIGGMIVAGLGMGLVMPVYTVAVQNVAPRHQLGAATASTIFFRSIGSTIGVAVFGSVMLTHYHRDLAQRIPADAPANAMTLLSNPMLLQQMRPQLDAAFRNHGGAPVLETLLASIGPTLERGLHLIFVSSAAMMFALVFLHMAIRNLRLRSAAAPEPELTAH
jgi:EmrB/QacA subfamily drug resistance transporter